MSRFEMFTCLVLVVQLAWLIVLTYSCFDNDNKTALMTKHFNKRVDTSNEDMDGLLSHMGLRKYYEPSRMVIVKKKEGNNYGN